MQSIAMTKTRRTEVSDRVLHGLRPLGLVWLVAGLALAGLLGGAVAAGIPVLDLTRDPTATMNAPFYTGAISQLGVLVWSAATTVALFCLAVLRHRGVHADAQRFFLASGLLSALLLLDDLFLLHESFFPFHLGVPEKLVLAGYASLALVYLLHFRGFISRTPFAVLLLAGAWFAASVLIDLASEQSIGMMVAEDVTKILGAVTWCSYFVYCGLDLLGVARTHEPDTA